MERLIGISGKKQHGKNTVASIIEYLCNKNQFSCFSSYLESKKLPKNKWDFKSYGHKLKQIASILTGEPVSNYDDEAFKRSKLSSDWDDSHGIDTHRDLLQVLGTDAMRDVIHPRIWINALFVDYVPNPDEELPNWLITDVRFLDEVEAIKSRKGVMIRVVNKNIPSTDTHRSETELDNYKGFDYEVNNSGSIQDLVDQVRLILILENIIDK